MSSTTKDKRRRTTMVPVTTMVEIPVLSEKERTELLASLKKAELRAKANKATDYDPKTFKDRLIGIYRGGKR
jgi:hypothetical protein